MSNISKEISIVTGSRLHWGLLAAENETGSSFGGVGVMIEQPSVHLSIYPCNQDTVSATDKTISLRVASFVATYRANCPDNFQPPPCKIVIHKTIPSHCGLGSGTQLAMAIAHGLALSVDAPFANDVKTLAKKIGRGARSAIGIHGFLSGGLIYDAGKKQREEISSIAATCLFPQAWRFLLVTPKDEVGLSGEKEKKAFRSFSIAAETTGFLTDILEERLLPAIINSNFEAFSAAIYDYGNRVGASFSKLQGGHLASPLMQTLSQELVKKGICGHGQTSWGPTLFILLPNEDAANQLTFDLTNNQRYATCHFQIVKPLNRGATVKMIP